MSAQRKRSSAAAEGEDKAITRKFKQYIRIRPLMESELKKNSKEGISNVRSGVESQNGEVLFMDPKCLAVNAKVNPTAKKKWTSGFDGIFWSFGEDPWVVESRDKTPQESEDFEHVNADNNAVYDEVKGDIVPMVFDGYNQTVCAYGPINSGKTYTLFGSDKEKGVATRLIQDIIDQLETQITQRQAPGEKLEMTVQAQLIRVYKEEIEDMLAGYPRFPKDGTKVQAGDIANSTKLDIHDPAVMTKFADRCWAQKESTRRPSSVTTPNKSNRSSVIMIITVTQKSTFGGADGEKSTESIKSSTLTIADIGFGTKADNEATNDYKKIALAQTTFQQVLRKLGEKAAHVPFNTSVLTRALADCLKESHVTLICNISPYHKSQAETGGFVELAEFGYKARSKAKPNEGEELSDFREKLEEQEQLKQEAVQQSKAANKVKAELEGRQARINELKKQLKEGEEDIVTLDEDIADQERKTVELQWQIKSQKAASASVLAYFERRETTAKSDLDEYTKRMEYLQSEIAKNEKRTTYQKEEIDKANSLLKKIAGLKSLLTGEPMKTDDGIFAPGTEEELAIAQEQQENVFDEQAEEAQKKLQEAIEKYEKVVSMNEENSKLMQEIQVVLTKVDDVEAEKAQVKEVVNRNKRKCIREIIAMMEEFTKGHADHKGSLQLLDDAVETYTTRGDEEASKFFHEQSNIICSVLGSELADVAPADSNDKIPDITEKAPLFLEPMGEMSPIRPWCIAMRPSKKLAADGGTVDTQGGIATDGVEVKYRVGKVEQKEIEVQHAVLHATVAYCEKILLRYNDGRQAIELAYNEWHARTPVWPTNANDAQNLLNTIKDQQAKVETLKKEVKGLEEDIKNEESTLKSTRALFENKTKAKRVKQEELKKELDKCVIL
eukprot:TRINITY_DN1251_c1_g1_i1.p1 TRINITY_DN1251_c1_g1~~TRINITY_DN1251_c1_g1_i1.p1  ORF type:complete len:896 (+),score=304.53 TRINITY_DN1251_c1_g1_i1:47-2734(+)